MVTSKRACPGDMDDTKSGRFSSYRETGTYTRGFLFVTLISAVATVVTPLQSQRMSGRSIISEEILERQQQQRNETSQIIPCLTAFMDVYFEVPGWVSIVLPDEPRDIPDLAEPLISALRIKKMTVYTVSVEMISVIHSYEGAADPIILSKDASALEGKDICLANYCKHDCDFMIVLTRPFADEASFLAEADKLIQPLCLRSIFELQILALVGDSAVIAGSPSSRTDGLYTAANTTILARCEQKDGGVTRWHYSIDESTGLLLGQNIVNAAMFQNFPYAISKNRSSGLTFSGIEGTMIEQIARSLKVQLNREIIGWKNLTVVESELQLRLYETMSSDVVFGGFLWTYDPKVEYTNSYGMVHITWLVPVHTNVSLRGLITPFSPTVWYAIICSMIIGALAKHFFFRDISFLDIVALLFGSVTHRQPVKNPSRIQYITWALFGFFVTQLYLGSLADQLMNASASQIETMDELMESGLQIGGTARLVNLLDTPDKSADDNVRRAIREHFIIFEENIYAEHIADIIAGRNNNLALLVMLNLTDMHHRNDIGHGHIVKESMGTYPLALATWRGFPYLMDINFKIQVLLQTGIIEYWSDMVALTTDYYEEESDVNHSTLGIKDIAPAFLLLIIGFAGGCLLLIVEILFYPSPFLL